MPAITKDEAMRELMDIKAHFTTAGMRNRVNNVRAYIKELELKLAEAIDQRNLALTEHATTIRELEKHITEAAATQAAPDLRRAVETVCEGWTLPFDARKILEAALWTSQEAAPTDLSAVEVPPLPETEAVVSALNDWLKKRGPLGPGATPDRPFFAGYAAGRASMKGTK